MLYYSRISYRPPVTRGKIFGRTRDRTSGPRSQVTCSLTHSHTGSVGRCGGGWRGPISPFLSFGHLMYSTVHCIVLCSLDRYYVALVQRRRTFVSYRTVEQGSEYLRNKDLKKASFARQHARQCRPRRSACSYSPPRRSSCTRTATLRARCHVSGGMSRSSSGYATRLPLSLLRRDARARARSFTCSRVRACDAGRSPALDGPRRWRLQTRAW